MTNAAGFNIRIDSMVPHEEYTLVFGTGPDANTERAMFEGIIGEGAERRARFRSNGRTEYVWDAYRYNGRWAFGTSAERLSARI